LVLAGVAKRVSLGEEIHVQVLGVTVLHIDSESAELHTRPAREKTPHDGASATPRTGSRMS